MGKEELRRGYTIHEDKDGNTVQISEDVIASIAAMSMKDIKGVYAVGTGMKNGIMEKFGWEDLAKGVTVEVLEDGVIVDVVITVNFDKKIMEVSKEVQDKIQTTIKDMTDMDVIAVNVRVAGVNEAPEA
ncbi:MAG: Asp23/Gls24 family envelope stress response protein [Lachnospiraceae bacterium]|nr:Asp23/Gls24 family envelope stress response protein [Lachnospiraceae bacterium]